MIKEENKFIKLDVQQLTMKDVTQKDQWNEESVNEIEIIKVIEKFMNREDSTFETNIYIYIYILYNFWQAVLNNKIFHF